MEQPARSPQGVDYATQSEKTRSAELDAKGAGRARRLHVSLVADEGLGGALRMPAVEGRRAERDMNLVAS